MELDSLKRNIEERATQIENMAKGFRDEMTTLIEEVKNNEILNAIKGINQRLSAIEARLPVEEEES